MFYSFDPGNGIDSISVASVDNTVIPLQNATVHGVKHDPITYYDALPLPITATLPVFATSTDTTVADDACGPLPDNTPDLSKFVVIVRAGTCTPVGTFSNVTSRNADFVVCEGPETDKYRGERRQCFANIRVS